MDEVVDVENRDDDRDARRERDGKARRQVKPSNGWQPPDDRAGKHQENDRRDPEKIAHGPALYKRPSGNTATTRYEGLSSSRPTAMMYSGSVPYGETTCCSGNCPMAAKKAGERSLLPGSKHVTCAPRGSRGRTFGSRMSASRVSCFCG